MEYDWDDDKAATILAKHGVSFPEAATVFDDPLSVTFPDPDHSAAEARLIIIGRSALQRLLFVAHTDRASGPRIISAREMTRREKKVYEEEQ